MAIQLGVTVRNARLAAIETIVGAAAHLAIRTGAPPANCAAANSGTLLATIDLPADWLDAPASGAVTLLGVWSVAAIDTDTAGHFRIYDGAVCYLQGTIGTVGSGADMELNDITITSGQIVTVTAFTLTDDNT